MASTLSEPFTDDKNRKIFRRPISADDDDDGPAQKKPNVAPVKQVYEWNAEQLEAIEAVVVQGKNTFITGPGGSGKTTLLKHLVAELSAKHGYGKVHVCATTGIAALPLSGTTLHAFAGVGLGNDELDAMVAQVNRNKVARQRWQTAAVLIVDEVSMLHADFLQTLDHVGKNLRPKQKHLAFGGIQLVFTGDFLQLPPVDTDRESTNKLKYAFESPVWSKCIQTMIGLKQIYRQKDVAFMELLNRFRYGCLTTADIDVLKSRVSHDEKAIDKQSATYLYPHKSPAENHNTAQLDKLDSEPMSFEAEDWCIEGDRQAASALTMLQKNCPAASQLTLKKGALVLLLKNIMPSIGLVNGARGIVTKVFSSFTVPLGLPENGELPEEEEEESSDHNASDNGVLLALPGSPAVTVKFDNGIVATIGASTWSVERTNTNSVRHEICSRKQVPFCLAWAISIHKSQGMTLDVACVSLQNLFEPSQGYVACSRLTNLEGLTILGNFDPALLMVDNRVVEFYKKNNL